MTEDLPRDVFGWNPFLQEGRDITKEKPLPPWAAENHAILQLTDLYQQQLSELVASHGLLQNDQESLAAMLSPFVDPKTGFFSSAPDETVLLMKRGLDLRLLEFEEDCRRVQKIERRLQRLIERCTLAYETSLIETNGFADRRLLAQIEEMKKTIKIQQNELDEMRFQRDLYVDETWRLRQLCKYSNFQLDKGITLKRQESPPPSPRTLHRQYAGAKPPFAWMRQIRRARGRTTEPRPEGHGRRGDDVARQHADRPFKKTVIPEEATPSGPAAAVVERDVAREETAQAGSFLSKLGGLFGSTEPQDVTPKEKEAATAPRPSPSIVVKASSPPGKNEEPFGESGNSVSFETLIKSPSELTRKPIQSMSFEFEQRGGPPQGSFGEAERPPVDEARSQRTESELFDDSKSATTYLGQPPRRGIQSISAPPSPTPFEERRNSGLGLTLRSRRSSSRLSSSSAAPRRTVMSPKPTTIREVTSRGSMSDSQSVASKFF